MKQKEKKRKKETEREANTRHSTTIALPWERAKMETLPEVLRVVISKALTSGKKLSWNVWDNGEITGVKLLWKPEVDELPARSEFPPTVGPLCGPVTTSAHLDIPQHKKHNKKRSPSSWRRSKQRLLTFLENKKGKEQLGESQDLPATPIRAPPLPLPPATPSHAPPQLFQPWTVGPRDTGRNQVDAAPREDGEPTTAPLGSEQADDDSEDDHSLAASGGDVEKSSLDASPGIDLTSCHAVRFEMQEDTPGLHFTSATGEVGWTPVVKRRRKKVASKSTCTTKVNSVSSDDEDFQSSLHSARSVTYKECDGVAGLSVRRGCTMKRVAWIPVLPSPIASRTRTRNRNS